MKRYIAIALLAAVLVGGLGYFFYTYWRNTQSRPLEDALLQNTSFYLSTSQALEVFSSINSLPYGQGINALPVFNRLQKQVTAFDSLLQATGYTLAGFVKAKDGSNLAFTVYNLNKTVGYNNRQALDNLVYRFYQCGASLTS